MDAAINVQEIAVEHVMAHASIHVPPDVHRVRVDAGLYVQDHVYRHHTLMMVNNHVEQARVLEVARLAHIHLHAVRVLAHVSEDVVASVIRALADVEQIHAPVRVHLAALIVVARVSVLATLFAAAIAVELAVLVVIATVQTVVRTHAATLDAMEYALQKTCKI